MSLKVISDPLNINTAKWSEFILNHPNGNIFQTPQIFEVYKNTHNYVPIIYIVLDNNEIVGVLSGVIQKEYKGIIGYLSARCIIFGGPLVKHDNAEISNLLLKTLNSNIKNKVIYTQFRNLFDLKNHFPIFRKNGFRYKPHLDIQIDLNQSSDNYWKSLKSKLRQNIRKAYKNGIMFYQIQSEEELFKAYDILKEVYKNAKLPIPDISLFLNANNILRKNKNVVFFKAEKNEKLIGIRFVLLFKGLVYDWYAGSKKQFYQYNPNDFLPYKVLKWGMNNPEYTTFNFGGAGKPNIPYGVRDHKLKFGGNLVNYGRFQRVYYPILFNLLKFVFKIWRKLKS